MSETHFSGLPPAAADRAVTGAAIRAAAAIAPAAAIARAAATAIAPDNAVGGSSPTPVGGCKVRAGPALGSRRARLHRAGVPAIRCKARRARGRARQVQLEGLGAVVSALNLDALHLPQLHVSMLRHEPPRRHDRSRRQLRTRRARRTRWRWWARSGRRQQRRHGRSVTRPDSRLLAARRRPPWPCTASAPPASPRGACHTSRGLATVG